MNLNKLLILLLEENAACWNGTDWEEFTDETIEKENIWINYLLSFSGGPRFEIWKKDDLIDVNWTIEQLERTLEKVFNEK